MSFLAPRSLVRSILGVLGLVLIATLLPAPAADARVQRVSPRFFGMTDNDPLSWPQRPVGSIRLWDSGVAWRDIERSPGVFDWSRLDAVAAKARSEGAKPLLVLGLTPRFHAQHPRHQGLYGPGTNSMPDMKPFRRYVRKVVRRYGSTMDYQVWNEANVLPFFSGTPKQMAKLTKATYKIVNQYAPRAKVLSPALATRLTGQRKWLRTYFAQRVGGTPVKRYMDVVALHLYPLPDQGPEASMSILDSVKTMLRWANVRKPIWNTEINYGIRVGGGGTASNISRAREAAFVARTYILNAAKNVKRVYWYSWQVQNLTNTQLTQDDGVTLTRAGRAYGVVRDWMVRTSMQGCDRDRRGTYVCELTNADGVRRIYWNPSRRATIRAVRSAFEKQTLRGYRERLTGRERIRVGSSPIMISSKR